MGKAKETEEKSLAKQGGGEAAMAVYGQYAEYGNAGFEDTTSEDFSVPFLTVLQALSPEVTSDTAIEGAKPGMLFNTVTGELIDGRKGLNIVIAHREQVMVEWVPRDQGGGYVGRHEMTSELVAKAKAKAQNPNKLKTESGNDLIQTAYLYVVVCHEDGRLEPAIIACTSTKLKKYRHLMTRLNQFQVQVDSPQGSRKVTPPIFAHFLRVTTVPEKNKKGSYYNFEFSSVNGNLTDSLLPPSDERFLHAVKLREMVQSGRATANYEAAGSGDAAGADGDEIPF